MVAVYLFLFLFLEFSAADVDEADPCIAHKLLWKMELRGSRCSTFGKAFCDRLIDGGWYKAVHKEIPLDMPTSCVNPAACGTGFPIWLNGTLPSVPEGVVQRQACVRGLGHGDCCFRRYNISVKNCGAYNVYNLPYTVACDEAYCFGNHDCGSPVNKTSSSVLISGTTSATSSLTSQGNVNDPCITHKLLWKMELRGTGCFNSDKAFCDRLIDGGWYKAVYEGFSLDMPTNCVYPASCGTGFPIWMNGKLPSVSEGVVQRLACVRGLGDGNCCIRVYNISVKNCGTYNVYYLPYTVACDEAYCFGGHYCRVSATKSTSSVMIPSEITTTSSSTSQESAKGNAAHGNANCKNNEEIAAIVAGCLCSAAVGSLITFLVLYRFDGTRRGKIDLTKTDAKTGNHFF